MSMIHSHNYYLNGIDIYLYDTTWPLITSVSVTSQVFVIHKWSIIVSPGDRCIPYCTIACKF